MGRMPIEHQHTQENVDLCIYIFSVFQRSLSVLVVLTRDTCSLYLFSFVTGIMARKELMLDMECVPKSLLVARALGVSVSVICLVCVFG